MNGEQTYVACRIVGSNGLGLTQSFYRAPVGQWGKIKDWWLADLDHYVQSGLNYLGPLSYRALPNRLPNQYPEPPRWIPPQGQAAVTIAPAGITIFQPGDDEAFKLIYDPAEIVIAI